MVMDVMDLDPPPSHVVVCMDSKNSCAAGGGSQAPHQSLTWRHEVFPAYKAHRDPTPLVVAESADHIQRMLAPMNIPCIREMGIEADDCIATVATRAAEAGMLVSIISLDSDYYQLLSPQVRMLKPPTRRTRDQSGGAGAGYLVPYTDEDFRAAFEGLDPAQWVDVQALKGDSSDNIPGVKGIGEKSALPLVREFGTVEEVLLRKGEVKDTRARNCLAKDGAEDAARLSKDLVKLRKAARYPSLEVPLEHLRWRHPSEEMARKALGQLEALEMGRTRDRLLDLWVDKLGMRVPEGVHVATVKRWSSPQ